MNEITKSDGNAIPQLITLECRNFEEVVQNKRVAIRLRNYITSARKEGQGRKGASKF